MTIQPYRADALPEEERAVHRKVLAGAYTATVDDRARQLACSGTWTLTLPSAADLGPGWWCYVENSGTGTITVDPEGSDTVDGAATATVAPGETRLITCDGASAYDGVVIRQGAGEPVNASFTIGSEASDIIEVTVQLLDDAGNDVARRSVVFAYISPDSAGAATQTVDGTNPGAVGDVIRSLDLNSVFMISDTSGQCSVKINETGAMTVYLAVVMPDSSIVVSEAIEFV